MTERIEDPDTAEQLVMLVLDTFEDDGDAAALEFGDDLGERMCAGRIDHAQPRHPDDHDAHVGVVVGTTGDGCRNTFGRTEEHRSVEQQQGDVLVAGAGRAG